MTRPFDEARYKGLLEGLEISVVRYSEVQGPLRTEAEYYQKRYLALENRLIALPHQVLEDIREKITDGTHFTPEYTETGIPFLSALNVLENRLDFDVGHRFISSLEHQALYRRCDPGAGDVLLRKVGVGPRLAAVVPDNLSEFSIFVSGNCQASCRLNACVHAAILNSKSPPSFSSFSVIL